MLVTLKDVLKIAEAKKLAVGAFNTPNLESLTAVLEAKSACGDYACAGSRGDGPCQAG